MKEGIDYSKIDGRSTEGSWGWPFGKKKTKKKYEWAKIGHAKSRSSAKRYGKAWKESIGGSSAVKTRVTKKKSGGYTLSATSDSWTKAVRKSKKR